MEKIEVAKVKVIKVVRLNGELLFKPNTSDIYFDAINATGRRGEEIIIVGRDSSPDRFEHGYVFEYGTHGSYEYFAGLENIFPKDFGQHEKMQLIPDFFEEGNEIVLDESWYDDIVSLLEALLDTELLFKQLQKENIGMEKTALSMLENEELTKFRNGERKLGVPYPAVKVIRDRTDQSSIDVLRVDGRLFFKSIFSDIFFRTIQASWFSKRTKNPISVYRDGLLFDKGSVVDEVLRPDSFLGLDNIFSNNQRNHQTILPAFFFKEDDEIMITEEMRESLIEAIEAEFQRKGNPETLPKLLSV